MVHLSVISLHHVTSHRCLQIARQIHVALSGRNGLTQKIRHSQEKNMIKFWTFLCRFRNISLQKTNILSKFA